jgi:hypothetical protein
VQQTATLCEERERERERERGKLEKQRMRDVGGVGWPSEVVFIVRSVCVGLWYFQLEFL